MSFIVENFINKLISLLKKNKDVLKKEHRSLKKNTDLLKKDNRSFKIDILYRIEGKRK